MTYKSEHYKPNLNKPPMRLEAMQVYNVIIELTKQFPEGVSPVEIRKVVKQDHCTLEYNLRRLLKEGMIEKIATNLNRKSIYRKK